MDYNVIKEYYNKGLFNQTDLDLLVECGWITIEQKNKIISNKA